MVDELGLNPPNMIETVIAIAQRKQLFAFRQQISKLLHDILEMAIIPIVMHHALNNPFIIDLRVEITAEDLRVEAGQIGEEDKPIRVLDMGLHVLNYDHVDLDEF